MTRVANKERDRIIFETRLTSKRGWRTIGKAFELSHIAVKKAFFRELGRRELIHSKTIDIKK